MLQVNFYHPNLQLEGQKRKVGESSHSISRDLALTIAC